MFSDILFTIASSLSAYLTKEGWTLVQRFNWFVKYRSLLWVVLNFFG